MLVAFLSTAVFLECFLISAIATVNFQGRAVMQSDPAFPASLDCGQTCHNPECEKRHLDAVEKRRWVEDAGFTYPKKPSVVITASRDMGRTAST